MHNSTRSLLLSLVFALTACSGEENRGTSSNGGATGVGGSTVDGASTPGGYTNRGGTSITVGTTIPIGGNVGAGGTSSTTDSPNTGGAKATGGATSTGGAKATGGATSTGGAKATGGATSTGGAKATGGATSTGGAKATGGASSTTLPAHIIGADVTISLEDEYWGATYTDNGTTKSIEQLLKDHGFNFIRLDTFVEPDASGGYAAGMEESFRDLTHTIAFAKRVKTIGLGFMLDLHYSNTWTNPAQQATPTAWVSLGLTDLENQVYSYTKDAVTKLFAAGAKPDIVQIGNEITNGMLWTSGRITNSNFAGVATLLKAGIRGVREVDSSILVMLHIDKCNNTTTSKWWVDGVLTAGVSFDILGQSCYAAAPNGVTGYQGTPSEWQATFAALASSYPELKFLIAEYSAEQRAAHDTMHNLAGGRGLGAFNWDPTRSYSTHPNHPLFTTNGAWNRYVAVPELMALYDKMAKDYGLK